MHYLIANVGSYRLPLWKGYDMKQVIWEISKQAAGWAVVIGICALVDALGIDMDEAYDTSDYSTGSSEGGSVWTVGHGGKKGYGSWSSLRHR